MDTYPQDVLFCRLFNRKDLSQYCCKPSSFFCSNSLKCVSKHRLRCQGSTKCLLTSSVGNNVGDCLNRQDEYIFSLKCKLLTHVCTNKNGYDESHCKYWEILIDV